MPKKMGKEACRCEKHSAGKRSFETRANSVDSMFRAFSERTRLRILHLLLDGEMCVGDLVAILETTQPRASQHLAYLRNAGLVTARKDGLWIYYSLALAKSPFHKKLLECLKQCFSEVPELQADEKRAKKLRRSGRCCSYSTE
jgi:ArsR family transcriptional regulator, arsenate/arsenite/antimonite-responsive transcriptional repressor